MNGTQIVLLLAWLSIALVAMAVAGMIRQLRDLQRLFGGSVGLAPSQLVAQRLARSSLADLADTSSDRTAILVVGPQSRATPVVVSEFMRLAVVSSGIAFVVVSAVAGDWASSAPEGAPLRIVVDPHLIADSSIPFCPALVQLARGGHITCEPVGSAEMLRTLLLRQLDDDQAGYAKEL